MAGHSPDVLVVGGGFAGLAAATALAEAGAGVALLEARPHLGGRARSWVDAATGAVVDNGQHLFMGCYRDTLRFLERIGTIDRLALQPRLSLPLVEPGGREGTFGFSRLPSPWDLIAGLLRCPGLRLSERVRLLRVARDVAHRKSAADLEDRSVAEWLAGLGQSGNACARLWYPLAIAALNEDPETAAASLFLPVLREALLSGSEGARLGFSRVGLSELYAEPAAHYLRARGAEVRLRSPVRRVVIEGGRFAWALLADGTRLPAGGMVAAVPPDDLLEILPAEITTAPQLAGTARLQTSPIVSVYLWFGVEVIRRPFAGILGRTWQWIFSRTPAGRTTGGLHGVTLVRSAARDMLGLGRDALVRSAIDDLHACFPVSRRAALRHALVIKERKATLSPVRGVESLRPSTLTPWPNLHLAGDWVATGLPATVEGAVRSGHACARQAIGAG